MPIAYLDVSKIPQRRSRFDSRLWREWCFWRVVGRHFRWRAGLLLAVLFGGAAAFRAFEPESEHSTLRAMWYTWLLVFGEPPEDFPRHPALQALFFVMPVLGLVVIIESIVDLSLMLRDRRRAERSWCVTMAASLSEHVVLIGLGRLGYRAFRLLRRLGEAVVVIENQGDNEFIEAVRRDGAPLLIGDARRHEIQQDANIAKAKSVICATNDDLANLEIALDARRIKPGIRVVLRMFDQNMADKVREGFNIKLAMSQAAISAPTFAMAAIDPSIIGTVVVDEQLLALMRWTVREAGPLSGRTVGEAMKELSLGIVKRRTAAGAALFPSPDTRLEPGDELLLQGPFEALLKLRRALPA